MNYPVKISKKQLFILSIPIFFSNLAIPLVGIVDTALMGNLRNANFLAATSIATTVITMVFWSFGFLRMSSVGLISQSLGKGDYREIVFILLRCLTISFIIGIFLILMKNPLLISIEYFFEPSIEIQNLIKKYISVRIFSAPAELAMYALVGFYLGLQKTKISSLMISTFCLTNIIFSTYFVLALNLEVYGVALGTLLSSYLTTIVFLIYTKYFIKKKFDIIPKFKKIFIRKKIFKLLYINLNIFIRTLLLTFAFLYFTFQSSKLGVDFLATNAILLQFVILASFFLDAYAFSTESVVGFSIGRNIKKTFLHVVNNCFQLSFFTSLIISIIYLIFYKLFINFLTNLEYIRYLAYGFSFWIILIPPIASFCYQFDGIFIGSSLTAEMRNSMIISLFLFILISDFLVKYFNNNGLWLSLIIFMILRSLTLNFYFSNILKKFK